MKRREDAWRDESWEAVRYKVHIKRADGQQGAEVGSFMADVDDGSEDAYSDRGRATLAAQAPAMARLLLELQLVDTSDGEYAERCPSCQGKTYGNREPGKAGIPVDFHPGKHSPDCELVAVLRAAGVLDAG